MGYWEGIRYLTGSYFKQATWKIVFSIIFVSYILIFTLSDYKQVIFGESNLFEKIFLDFIFILVMSSVGLMVTHIHSFGTKKDLLGERLAYMRSLPIKIEQIIWSRLLNVIINIFSLMLFFYILLYAALRLSEIQVELLPFSIHIIGLLAITLMGNMFYLYCELMYSLKKYTLLCWIMPAVIALIIASYVLLSGYSLIEYIYIIAVSHPILLLFSSLLVIVLTIVLSFKALNKRLRQRSIL